MTWAHPQILRFLLDNFHKVININISFMPIGNSIVGALNVWVDKINFKAMSSIILMEEIINDSPPILYLLWWFYPLFSNMSCTLIFKKLCFKLYIISFPTKKKKKKKPITSDQISFLNQTLFDIRSSLLKMLKHFSFCSKLISKYLLIGSLIIVTT